MGDGCYLHALTIPITKGQMLLALRCPHRLPCHGKRIELTGRLEMGQVTGIRAVSFYLIWFDLQSVVRVRC